MHNNRVNKQKCFLYRKTKHTKCLALPKGNYIVSFGQLYFSLNKFSIAWYSSFWQVEMSKGGDTYVHF
nr:MAG TPA: hypothetical protein [Caudoviricetes sp.]